MKKHTLGAAIAAILGVTSLSAQAALVIEGGERKTTIAQSEQVEPEKKAASSTEQRRHDWRYNNRVILKEFGEGSPSGYTGFGKDMTLSTSLSLIVPERWTVKLTDAVDPEVKTNWNASEETWVEGLAEVMKSTDYSARVFWNKKTVEIEAVPSQTPEIDTIKQAKAEKAEKSEKAEPQPKEAESQSEGGKVKAAPQENDETKVARAEVTETTSHGVRKTVSSAPSSATAPALKPSFTVNAGEKIGQALAAWGRSLSPSWTVVWNTRGREDWKVPSTTTFHGDFKSVATQIVEALRANGIDIEAEFWSNRTLVVTVET